MPARHSDNRGTIVSERLGHASVTITLDTYSHVIPGLQEDAAEKFSQIVADGR